MGVMPSKDQNTEMVNAHHQFEKILDNSNASPMPLPLEFLKAITRNFSDEMFLGKGGFGAVYKGILRSGKIIAVKRLSVTYLGDDMFKQEAGNLMGIKHQNIVQLVGYCAESASELFRTGSGRDVLAERPIRLLCFEHLSNKSLDKHIYNGSVELEWNMRYQIIKGICNGLHFLHEECRIVHLDLKPENILMDSTMTPKIADFGISRIFGEQETRRVTTSPMGTLGYMAQEYLTNGVISNKADMFSLGVIIIEIITGGRDYPSFQQDSPQRTAASVQQFTEKVLESWRNKFVSKYEPMARYIQQVRQCIDIALKCVHPRMEERPTAKDIIQMLDALEQQAIPPFIQIIRKERCEQRMVSLDVSHIKPWIITGHDHGYIDIFDYETQKSIGSDTGDGSRVHIIKFIERKQWFIVGSLSGYITVYTYQTKVQKITSFRAKGRFLPIIESLAVHPTQPYVLSSCKGYIQLWDWDNNWQCIRTFEKPSVFSLHSELKFNPNDTNEFASAEYNEVKIWNTGSLKHIYALCGHSDNVKCLNFFTHDDNQQYLVTGSSDKTVKIWDMRIRACVYTLEGLLSPVIFVGSCARLSVLITGTKDGLVHLWSATNSRPMRTLKVSSPGGAYDLACLTGSGRLVMGNMSTLCMINILDEEPDALAGNEEPVAS